jgi:pimeloyl-ACP methyl ester carboxylesterase
VLNEKIKSVVIHDKAVAYSVAGAGVPVVLIHGFGEDGRIWNEVHNALTKHAIVLQIHLPGSGLSDYNESLHTIDDFASVVNKLLEIENIQRAILIGHSMGGYICLAVAEKYPELVMGLGLVNSTAYADSDERKIARQRNIEFIQKKGAAAFLQHATPNLFAASTRTQHKELVEQFIQQNEYHAAQVLVQYQHAMLQRPDRSNILQYNFSLGLLFVAGKLDETVKLADVIKQSSIPNLSTIHVIQNAAHMAPIEAPNELANYLQDYISHT